VTLFLLYNLVQKRPTIMTDKQNTQVPEAEVVSSKPAGEKPPGTAMSIWKPSKRSTSLAIPSHWEADPNCGEYMTTLNEDDPKMAKLVALALAGKTKSGKNSQNKRLKVIGITIVPFLAKKNDEGYQDSKIGFHLHTAAETVFVAHYHAKADIIALVGRYGVPSPAHPVDVVIDPVPEANTYRVLAADLVSE
jgi:hypothetical protein